MNLIIKNPREEIRESHQAEVKKLALKDKEMEQMQKWMNSLRDQQQTTERISKPKVRLQKFTNSQIKHENGFVSPSPILKSGICRLKIYSRLVIQI